MVCEGSGEAGEGAGGGHPTPDGGPGEDEGEGDGGGGLPPLPPERGLPEGRGQVPPLHTQEHGPSQHPPPEVPPLLPHSTPQPSLGSYYVVFLLFLNKHKWQSNEISFNTSGCE